MTRQTDLALVTGATGIVGTAISRHLTDKGWAVAVTSRDQVRAERLASKLGPRSVGLAFDLGAPDAAERISAELAERNLRVTHLINNARSLDALAVGADGTTASEAFLDELEIDVVQPYRLTMVLAEHPAHALRAVVNIGSQYGEVAMNPALYDGVAQHMPIQYGVAKAALHHLTRELASRLAPEIRVNCVAFGGFTGRAPDEFVQCYAGMLPMGRMLAPEEAGGPVAFLLDDDSSAMTGHVLHADGGWSIR